MIVCDSNLYIFDRVTSANVERFTLLRSGAYLGGVIGPRSPSLGRQDSIISIE